MSQQIDLRPSLPKPSIFPRARRVSALIATTIGITASLLGAINWIAQTRSEYDALRLEVGRLGLKLSDVTAQCATDKRELAEKLDRSDQVTTQLRIALAAIETWLRVQPARNGVRPADTMQLKDAKQALGRAQTLQPMDGRP